MCAPRSGCIPRKLKKGTCCGGALLGLLITVGMIFLALDIPDRMLDWARIHTTWFVAKPNEIIADIQEGASDPILQASSLGPTTGPLQVSPANPRYFTDGSGKAIYLTGLHTWSNFQDNGGSDPPPEFNYTLYLDFLQSNHHNFFRLWTWEQARWTLETSDDNYWFYPATPYLRTGPGTALDGKPKFDLNQFDQAYFDRMRSRVQEAGERGIYVSIMLFNGWSVQSQQGGMNLNNPWRGHPFNANNNINEIDGDPNGDNDGRETHTLSMPAVNAIQEAYIRKVIDTVNDLDNVLYEISNESDPGSKEWQYHMINYIKNYEEDKSKQHPVGMTHMVPDPLDTALYNSNADWISIYDGGSYDNPSEAEGSKVIILDTDHITGIGGDRVWVWKSFTRGMNPIFMDGYDGAGYGVGGANFDFDTPQWINLRRNMGYTRSYADRMNLVAMEPRGDLASTGYCLANPAANSAEYLVYLPSGGTTTVDLSASPGELTVEWFNPGNGTTTYGGTITGGTQCSFTAPFSGDAVLYIYQSRT
jgi:hypothetical protein